MMDTAKLIIHIGTHKTGSSAIQQFLRHHRNALKQKGLVYISLHDGYESLMHAGEINPAIVRGMRKNLFCQVGRNFRQDGRTYVASWEGFSGDPMTGYRNAAIVAEHLKQCLRDIPARIIVYLRPQDSFMSSLYTQTIHEGASGSFEKFFNDIPQMAFDWKALLDTYGEAFGRSNIVVKRYHKKYLPNPSSLLIGFFKAIDIGIEDLLAKETHPAKPNKGYSRDALEFARLCNPELSERDQKRLRRILQKTSSKQPFEKYTYLDPEEKKKFMQQYEETNQSITEDYLKNPRADLFPPPPASTEAPKREMNVEEIIPEVVPALLRYRESHKESFQQFLYHRADKLIKGLYRKFPWLTYKLRSMAWRCGLR